MFTKEDSKVCSIQIVDYQEKYQPDFYRLNAAWIEPNFGLEEEDINFLSNPQTEILDKGGVIFFALLNEIVVGTCGLYKMDDETYELIRTAVDSHHQGLQIGRRIVEHAIDWAKNKPAKRVILESSLKPVNAKAVKMYEQMGFQHYTPRPEHRSDLSRAQVWMCMEF